MGLVRYVYRGLRLGRHYLDTPPLLMSLVVSLTGWTLRKRDVWREGPDIFLDEMDDLVDTL